MTIDQAINRGFSTECKLTVEFSRYNFFVERQSKLVVVEGGR